MTRWVSCLLLVIMASVPLGCSSSVDALLNAGQIQDQVETIEDCFPDSWDKVVAVFQFAEYWAGTETPPATLTCEVLGDANGSIVATLDVGNCVISMTTTFRNAGGTLLAKPHTLPVGNCTPTQYQNAIDEAAGNMVGGDLVVGNWTLASGIQTISGQGELTGQLDGAGDLALITTTAVNSGGQNPQASTVTNTTTGCTLTASTTGLDLNQAGDYIIGAINFALTGPLATANAVLNANGTENATINVTNVPGSFSFSLLTFNVTYNP